MRYIADHDFHIHSKLSLCSDDPQQTKEAMLQYAKDNGFRKIVVTDHFWDKSIPNIPEWYTIQDYDRVSRSLPLPQLPGIDFKFGCETDIDANGVLGIARETFDKFDFVIIPITHMHMPGLENKTNKERRELYISRFRGLFDLDIPFKKVGMAHLTCPLLAGYNNWEGHLEIINSITDSEFEELFSLASQKGVGIELNMPIFKYSEEESEQIMRPYRIAKDCGCKFYLGSDAHHPDELEIAKKQFERMIDLLKLEESDKFDF